MPEPSYFDVALTDEARARRDYRIGVWAAVLIGVGHTISLTLSLLSEGKIEALGREKVALALHVAVIALAMAAVFHLRRRCDPRVATAVLAWSLLNATPGLSAWLYGYQMPWASNLLLVTPLATLLCRNARTLSRNGWAP